MAKKPKKLDPEKLTAEQALEGYRRPRISHSSQDRIVVKLSGQDAVLTRRLRGDPDLPAVVVADQLTGKKYRWETAACSLPTCFCDAVVTEV